MRLWLVRVSSAVPLSGAGPERAVLTEDEVYR